MRIRVSVSVLGLCVLGLAAGWLTSPALKDPGELLKSDARTLARLEEAHLLDFYQYTGNPDRMAFQPWNRVVVRIELTADRLGWSSVLTDERRPGLGCAVFGGSVSRPLPSPGGVLPSGPGVPACDPGL